MNHFLSESTERRRLVFEQSAARLNLAEIAVEKDFWVCWTLSILFGLPDWGASFSFKGGTSLSKGWRLIERFSEDMDIVIDRTALGFHPGPLIREDDGSRRRKRALEQLGTACRRAVQDAIGPGLIEHVRKILPDSAVWEIVPDPHDSDGQTLLFAYPSVFQKSQMYLKPIVRIELGARSDTEPHEHVVIRPYVAEVFPDVFSAAETTVRAVSPVRTFWEKAMLLHEELQRPPGSRRRGQYLARHYYDLYRLILSGIGPRAVEDLDLFRAIASHRKRYFRYGWLDYLTLSPGRLTIVPHQDDLVSWQQDYEAMEAEMFFGATPSFNEIIRVIAKFQDECNRLE